MQMKFHESSQPETSLSDNIYSKESAFLSRTGKTRQGCCSGSKPCYGYPCHMRSSDHALLNLIPKRMFTFRLVTNARDHGIAYDMHTLLSKTQTSWEGKVPTAKDCVGNVRVIGFVCQSLSFRTQARQSAFVNMREGVGKSTYDPKVYSSTNSQSGEDRRGKIVARN